MSELIRIVAVIAIVAYVVGRQFMGEALRGKRVVLLPIVLTVIGAIDVSGVHHRIGPADAAFLVVGAVLAASVGMGLGTSMRLQARDGYLWGQMPPKAGWLWVALIGSRLALTGAADGVHAHVAASSATILLMLGINRLGQAAIVLPRAMAAGIPFAPEKDGSSYLSGLTGTAAHAQAGSTASNNTATNNTATNNSASNVQWVALARQASQYVQDRRRDR